MIHAGLGTVAIRPAFRGRHRQPGRHDPKALPPGAFLAIVPGTDWETGSSSSIRRDVSHPFALNLFDAHMDSVKDYDPADKERVLNGVVELYETFFDALLGAELTARQDVVFRYIARLMLTIPGATIHTLMEIMEDGRAFKPYMERLQGSGRRFFETEFFSPLRAHQKPNPRNFWGVLSTPAFDRIFSQKRNRLDLFEALNRRGHHPREHREGHAQRGRKFPYSADSSSRCSLRRHWSGRRSVKRTAHPTYCVHGRGPRIFRRPNRGRS